MFAWVKRLFGRKPPVPAPVGIDPVEYQQALLDCINAMDRLRELYYDGKYIPVDCRDAYYKAHFLSRPYVDAALDKVMAALESLDVEEQ